MKAIILALVTFTLSTSQLFAQKLGETRLFKITDDIHIEMVWIEPGQFLMGSPESEPERIPQREQQHEVKITKGFWIAKTETTQKVWQAVMNSNPSKIKGKNLPIESINWNEAQVFIKKLNQSGAKFRLPYEAEWEYACRAGTNGPYAGERDLLTWHRGNANDTVHEVGTKSPNPWGLYDMHGNILEMCQDWFTEDISLYSTDPKGPQQGTRRVQRGGQYTGRIRHSRSADRQSYYPDQGAFFVGFRLVHD